MNTPTATEPANTTAYIESLFTERDGLMEFAGTSYDDHVESWREVRTALERNMWALAAIAASFERHCGARTDVSGQQTDIQRFCADVNVSRQHFHYLADTYRAFAAPGKTGLTGLIESPELNFKHFAVAASAADPVAAVIEAHDRGWSANELQRQLRRPAFEPVSLDLKTDFQCPACAYEWSGNPKPARPTGRFSLPEALTALRAAIIALVKAWPADTRHAAVDVLRTLADDIDAETNPAATDTERPLPFLTDQQTNNRRPT